MQNKFLKKGIVVATIFLFIGISMSSAVTAIDYNTEVDDEPMDSYNEFVESNEYLEIITWITAIYYKWIERRGIFRGEIECYMSGFPGSEVIIRGLRRSNGFIEIYSEKVAYVKAKFFIGYRPRSLGVIYGIALGNIDIYP